jgi:hypothetical protein
MKRKDRYFPIHRNLNNRLKPLNDGQGWILLSLRSLRLCGEIIQNDGIFYLTFTMKKCRLNRKNNWFFNMLINLY